MVELRDERIEDLADHRLQRGRDLLRDEGLERLAVLVETNLTPDVMAVLAKPGNFDWLEHMIGDAFKKVMHKPTLVVSSIRQ